MNASIEVLLFIRKCGGSCREEYLSDLHQLIALALVETGHLIKVGNVLYLAPMGRRNMLRIVS